MHILSKFLLVIHKNNSYLRENYLAGDFLQGVLRLFIIVITPLSGVISFTLMVKGGWSNNLAVKLPIYQGLSAYFSLVTLGFSYIATKQNILGIKIIPLILAIIGIPVCFYSYSGISYELVIPFVLILFQATALSFISLVLGCKHCYLKLQFFMSAFLPVCLALHQIYLILACAILFIFLLSKIYKNSKVFGFYTHSSVGYDLVKSLLIQSPLFILPFFDIFIIKKIGQLHYENYAVINKYITGILNMLFYYSQLKLLFGGGGVNVKYLLISLGTLLPFIILLSFSHNSYAFILLITLFAVSVNISSLLIRKMLLDGISIYLSLLGPISIALYYSSLIFFSDGIERNNGIFIALMFFSVTFPILVRFLIIRLAVIK